MTKFHYYLGCRVYESDVKGGFKFRLVVNYKSDDFILYVKDICTFGATYRRVCKLLNAKKILKYLGYKLEEFCDNTKCHEFMKELHILKEDVDKPLTFTYKRLKRFEDCIYFY